MQNSGSFDRFTERARKVMTLAQEEAQRFNHNYIGTEHLLLGLLREPDGVGARVLVTMGIELATIRTDVEYILGRGRAVLGDIGLTPRAKKVIEFAVDEARRLGHHYIGTEHLLLGMIREGEGIAAGVLENRGLTLERVRSQVVAILTQTGADTGSRSPQWQYLTLEAAFRDGMVHVIGFLPPDIYPDDMINLRIHHALRLLGEEGWELCAIAPAHQPGTGADALYLFKRPM